MITENLEISSLILKASCRNVLDLEKSWKLSCLKY